MSASLVRADLPIDAVLPDLHAALAQSTRVVLEAPPGAGKTTAVPLSLLDAPWLAGRRILMLEPRRIAARAAARFMAQSLGEDVGERVGYRIRFEARVSVRTRIEVLTEGILTRMIQDDPLLDGVGCLIFDEFHERHLASDLGLALALDCQAGLREDLRILLMSATLDGTALAQWLGGQHVRSAGRSYPVQIEHLPARREETPETHLARAVDQALERSEGDVLAFLPGRREIDRCARLLAGRLDARIDIVPLHGDLPIEAQSSALAAAAAGRRKVVLATNVAESSVTLPGVRAVVDAGLAREPSFDPNVGYTRLHTVAISQASADQRAGRAGRLGPGLALRLWPSDKRLQSQRNAEISRVDLAPLLLELAAWGGSDLRFLDPPPPGHLAQAQDLLRQLGALDEQGMLLAHGRELLRLGTHPRLANLVVHGRRDAAAGCIPELLALLEARDPLQGEARYAEDWRLRMAALQAWRQQRGAGASGALRAIDQSAQQWRKRLRLPEIGRALSAQALGNLLIHAYPDRIAKRDRGERYQLAGGRAALLAPGSALAGEPWLAISELGSGVGADARILKAAPFDPDLLQTHYPQRYTSATVCAFDPASGSVQQRSERRFGAIVLERRNEPVRDAAAALQGLLAGIRTLGIDALAFSPAQQRLRARLTCLRQWLPEAGLPDCSDQALLDQLDDWLAPYLHGLTRLSQLDAGRLGEALMARLDHTARHLLEQEAPDALTVPSGMSRKLEYLPGQPPVLAVKLQELFGLADTPRVGRGRVAVTLHLLSPAGRPIQVTQDLKGFWDRTYPEVKKELKGRYPKHPWPDDPWTAVATHRAKRRGE